MAIFNSHFGHNQRVSEFSYQYVALWLTTAPILAISYAPHHRTKV